MLGDSTMRSSSESKSCNVLRRPVGVWVEEEVDAETEEAAVEVEAEAAGAIFPNVRVFVFFAMCSLRN